MSALDEVVKHVLMSADGKDIAWAKEAAAELAQLRARLAEAERVIAPFARRNDEFIVTAMGMATVDFDWLHAAAEWMKNK